MRQPASVAATLERTDMSEEDEFELEPIEILELPLDAWHRDKGARMVEFAGYHMPIQYEGIMAEHIWTRESAGLFDVSHMGQLMIGNHQCYKKEMPQRMQSRHLKMPARLEIFGI